MLAGMDPAVYSSMSAHGQGDSTGTQDASQGRMLELVKYFCYSEDEQLLRTYCVH